MNSPKVDDAQASRERSRLKRFAPVLTLIVLAPFIAEVLSGATRISFIIVLIPEIMVWGCGALLIRETVRRWQGGWTSMLLLGLGLSVAEEFIIQQTSLAPLPWLGSLNTFGRIWGVNWVFFLYMLGYESVWVALVPIQVTELIFLERRDKPWLGTFGMIASGLIFVFGSFVAWFAWTQHARPAVFHVPIYSPPHVTILLGFIIILLLALTAFKLRNGCASKSVDLMPVLPLWKIGLVVLGLGSPWYLLLVLNFLPKAVVPFWVALIGGIAWAVVAFQVIRRVSAGLGWGDIHRWALVFAATLVCMLGGFLGSDSWPRIDLAGKIILNLMAVAGFVLLRQKMLRRAQA